MLLRDVDNLRGFFGRFDPSLLQTDHGNEIWDLYRRGVLHPGSELTGRFERVDAPIDLDGVIREIGDAQAEEQARLIRMQTAG
jgi:RIO kinase 1